MRGVLLSLVCAAGLLALTPAKSIASSAPAAPAHAQASVQAFVYAPAPMFALMQDKKVDIQINTSSGGGGRWYRSPVWIAIMAIGGVVLLMLIAMAVRGGSGGGTTIVK